MYVSWNREDDPMSLKEKASTVFFKFDFTHGKVPKLKVYMKTWSEK